MTKRNRYPLVALRGLTVFPKMTMHFDAGRDISITALEEAMNQGGEEHLCVLAGQKDLSQDDINLEDVYSVGALAQITQLVKLPGDAVRAVVEGVRRVRIHSQVDENDDYFEVEVIELESYNEPTGDAAEAWNRQLISAFEHYMRTMGKFAPDIMLSLLSGGDVGTLCDLIAANVLPKPSDKQMLLEELDVEERARKTMGLLQHETAVRKLENDIQQKVKQSIDKGQREYYLREQIKVIREELGDSDSPAAEEAELTEKLEALTGIPAESREQIRKEIKRYAAMPPGSHEAPMLRTWLDTAMAMPWGKTTQDDFDLDHVWEVLDADHYGLEKVKERMVEQLAVCKLRGDVTGSIICLVGPPGVGKTSIASSVARAIGRNFVRMSLGGVHDESEIRGHRRTYIGAMPGRIINAMKQAESMNPLILLDEIDKVGNDFRGDPAAALLEALDSAQNSTFRDHYLEMPFDLSKVLFITTANTLSTIPPPLRDRMEIVELSSYTEEEKVAIGQKHLLPKQLEKNGLPDDALRLDDDVMRALILGYTREAGVRTLERQLAKICRWMAAQRVGGKRPRAQIGLRKLEDIMGPAPYQRIRSELKPQIGVVTGLAWTSVGGETLEIEVTPLQGTGRLELTGQLGDVMQESARAAYTYARANAANWGIDPYFYRKTDLHVHIPEGAIPKDGPSAGIAMATAMISALSGIPVRGDVAMTGEITLHGNVLPIGGIKEKTIAAHREGIRTIILPDANRSLARKEIPQTVQEACKINYVKTLSEVLQTALTQKPRPYKGKEEAKDSGDASDLILPGGKVGDPGVGLPS